MSGNYAKSLSKNADRGILGTPEIFDPPEVVSKKVEELVDLILSSKHIVVHTGAGISTSTGIPDFRGPSGIWTLEEKGVEPTFDIDFQSAIPSFTHRALKILVDRGFIKYIVSQNIDGLHLKSGVKRQHLAELHGNFFIDECPKCKSKFIRNSPSTTVAQNETGEKCKNSARKCRGKLVDTILDWEGSLPEDDLEMSIFQSSIADLNLGLGSSFQIVPSGQLPLKNKRFGGKLALINLQPIKLDKNADLVIHSFTDDVLQKVLKRLGIEEVPEYDPNDDPTKKESGASWNFDTKALKECEKIFKDKVSSRKKKIVEPALNKKKEKIMKKIEK